MGQHAGTYLGPVKAVFSNGPESVKQSTQNKEQSKNRTEKKFRRKQFTHEIKLQHNADGKKRKCCVANPGVSRQAANPRGQIL